MDKFDHIEIFYEMTSTKYIHDNTNTDGYTIQYTENQKTERMESSYSIMCHDDDDEEQRKATTPISDMYQIKR